MRPSVMTFFVETYIGKEIYRSRKKETRYILLKDAIQQHNEAMIRKYGSLKNYRKHLLKIWGFKNEYEYRTHLAQSAGFESKYDYDNFLAKEQGFKDHSEYLNHLAMKKGFKNSYHLYKKESSYKPKSQLGRPKVSILTMVSNMVNCPMCLSLVVHKRQYMKRCCARRYLCMECGKWFQIKE